MFFILFFFPPRVVAEFSKSRPWMQSLQAKLPCAGGSRGFHTLDGDVTALIGSLPGLIHSPGSPPFLLEMLLLHSQLL